MRKVGSKDGFEVWFNTTDQTYSVYHYLQFVRGGIYNFTDVKSYLE